MKDVTQLELSSSSNRSNDDETEDDGDGVDDGDDDDERNVKRNVKRRRSQRNRATIDAPSHTRFKDTKCGPKCFFLAKSIVFTVTIV